LTTPEGKPFDLVAHVLGMKADKPDDDPNVLIQGAGNPMPARLVIARKPEAAARVERERLKTRVREKGKRLDPRSLLAAEFVVLATTGEIAASSNERQWVADLGRARKRRFLNGSSNRNPRGRRPRPRSRPGVFPGYPYPPFTP
jgi:RNase P protein component